MFVALSHKYALRDESAPRLRDPIGEDVGILGGSSGEDGSCHIQENLAHGGAVRGVGGSPFALRADQPAKMWIRRSKEAEDLRCVTDTASRLGDRHAAVIEAANEFPHERVIARCERNHALSVVRPASRQRANFVTELSQVAQNHKVPTRHGNGAGVGSLARTRTALRGSLATGSPNA